jgi:hypothetical protein
MKNIRARVWVAVAAATIGCADSNASEVTGDAGPPSGGASYAGGATAGGTAGSNGGAANSGAANAGGAVTTGGMSSTGGASQSGGTSSMGGTSNTGGTSSTGDGGVAASWWKPTAGTTWDWQLSSTDLSHAVAVYDIDYENDAGTVSALHAKGIKVICYVSVGSWEDYRPDASTFPAAVVGNDYPGWPGEKFVDIRAQALRSLMSARFDICKTKGFDGLEPDNMDVFESNSGFPLTSADGLDYARWLATEAHSRGMAIFQKNTSSLAPSLFALYDGAITEDCFDQGWCSDMLGYIQRNEPVFMAEYTDTGVNFANACTWAKTNQFSPILKDRDLTAALTTCP